MEMSAATLWWLAAGVAIAVELATGTFYLLMISVGLGAGALAAHAGLGMTAQIVAAALVGGGTTAVWHWKRAQSPRSLPAAQNRDVNLDIGDLVEVPSWASDGTARVSHRGSTWIAKPAPGTTARTGRHRVVAVEGNWLVLAPFTSD